MEIPTEVQTGMAHSTDEWMAREMEFRMGLLREFQKGDWKVRWKERVSMKADLMVLQKLTDSVTA